MGPRWLLRPFASLFARASGAVSSSPAVAAATTVTAATTASAGSALTPLTRYNALLTSGAFRADAPQEAAARALEGLYSALQRNQTPRGLYLHSGPGRGKTAVVHLLQHGGVRHVHSHEFFLGVHRQLHALRCDWSALVDDHVRGVRVLAFDELDVTDIADALLLQRLLGAMLSRGVVFVATSNRLPEALYAGGLNAALFQPAFARAVRASCDVICLDGGGDHRRFAATRDDADERLRNVQLIVAQRHSDALWGAVERACGTLSAPRSVPVLSASRDVLVPVACARAARFDFASLCGAEACASAADYAALAGAFDVVQLDAVPPLREADDDALRRFTVLVDVFYERRKVVLLGARGWRTVEDLFHGVGGAHVEPQAPAAAVALRVVGEGGASGRSTTMMSPTVEWSATGLRGARLVDLGTGRFAVEALPRTASRMHEMSRWPWARAVFTTLPAGREAIAAALSAT